ncbi:PREDICTED: ACT domain-containing protein ACR2 isoform X2 [Tarenaya hassleriana]|uniref:ACT domain-containing protein ACR2 isoform X2 n=1 Tax=Tarenaya hassleriana TaxID=28532 RepID=UPI00053C36D6|nr:PREDICTED: ACT domain-containing protein ACR2 isoform X2 [Tarenaya hassleriana]
MVNGSWMAIGTSTRKSSPVMEAKKTVSANNALESPVDQNEYTAIELTGTDRPGLFSEISAALADLHCNVLEAHAWSHKDRLACIAHVSDDSTHTSIIDPTRLATIEDHLTTVIRATANPTSNATHVGHKENEDNGFLAGKGSTCMNTNVERRLHQLMLSVRDFEEPLPGAAASLSVSPPPSRSGGLEMEGCDQKEKKPTTVSVENCERGYSIVTVKCKDRRRLMFDTVCTLIDMQCVIFHASIYSNGADAFQEYFIRHLDGRALNTEGEKERVVNCLEAAIERRVCEGVKLELCAESRVGLLSDITRVLRENGLTIVRADVETQGQKSVNAFYVRDMSGNKIDMEFVESVKKEMRPLHLAVKNDDADAERGLQRRSFSLGDIFRSQMERLSLR